MLNSEVSYVRYLDHVRYLDRSDREDVRLHQPRCANAFAFGLRGYVDSLSPVIAMHVLDRSCVIVGKFFEILRSPTHIILRIVYLDDHSLVITVHQDRGYWFFNHR